MGVTPIKGALTPAYKPLRNPSRATLLRTTSMADEYTPRSAVWRRTLTRSKGWPTTTAQTPPNPPAAKERTCERKLEAALSLTSSFAGKTASIFSVTAAAAAPGVVVSVDGIVEGERQRR